MKVSDFERMMAIGLSRRAILKTGASLGAVAAAGSMLGPLGAAYAQDASLRSQILQVPGLGKGSPTDADGQKVREMCLEATKKNVKQGEFAGVELSLIGLNNQNLHNVLFRGFLKPWEEDTGSKITWIDLAQTNYNP
ncbi:sugar ABC transporter substrate-binding protein, partial [Klebsiella pneumoniae]|uniref:hypothetical protein n=1 Tax=Klebsiella pneumoniae TaxID=573 RepID=UPI000FF3AF14